MKLLVLLLVLAVAVAWVLLRTRRKQAPPVEPPPEDKTVTVSQMLSCAHCGLHLPRSEALLDAPGRPYCSAEHRVAGPR